MRRRFPDALAQSQVRFNRDPEKVPEKVWEALVQSQGRFQRRSGSFGVEPGQVQQGSGTGSGEGSRIPGSIGAKPSQVQWFPEKVTEKAGRLWCRARAR